MLKMVNERPHPRCSAVWWKAGGGPPWGALRLGRKKEGAEKQAHRGRAWTYGGRQGQRLDCRTGLRLAAPAFAKLLNVAPRKTLDDQTPKEVKEGTQKS